MREPLARHKFVLDVFNLAKDCLACEMALCASSFSGEHVERCLIERQAKLRLGDPEPL